MAKKVLVVDDKQNIRLTIVMGLKKIGNFEIAEANNGLEALEILKKDAKNIGLIFSDVEMPEMGGIELYKQVKEDFPKIPFIMMSGRSEEDYLEIIDYEICFFKKPFDIKEVVNKIKEQMIK